MGHALRGVVTAWFGLIVFQTVATKGSGRVGSLFADANTLLQRAFDPNVPAIPDRRGGAGTPTQGFILDPAKIAAGAKAGANVPGVNAVTGPGGALSGMPSLGQYVAGGGLPAGITSNPALQPH